MKIAGTDQEILACYAVIAELRPHLESPEAFLAQVRRQQAQGYVLGYLMVEGAVAAAAGFRVGEFLAWGKIVYIDDLVTQHIARKRGLASELMDAIVAYAREHGCASVQLDSGYTRN